MRLPRSVLAMLFAASLSILAIAAMWLGAATLFELPDYVGVHRWAMALGDAIIVEYYALPYFMLVWNRLEGRYTRYTVIALGLLLAYTPIPLFAGVEATLLRWMRECVEPWRWNIVCHLRGSITFSTAILLVLYAIAAIPLLLSLLPLITQTLKSKPDTTE